MHLMYLAVCCSRPGYCGDVSTYRPFVRSDISFMPAAVWSGRLLMPPLRLFLLGQLWVIDLEVSVSGGV